MSVIISVYIGKSNKIWEKLGERRNKDVFGLTLRKGLEVIS